MRKQHFITLLAFFGIITISVARWWLGSSEPCYRGKSLSDWIVATEVHPEDPQARAAMLHLGSNSIPALLEWVQRDDRLTAKGAIGEAKDHVISFLEAHKIIKPQPRWTTIDRKSSYRALAQRAFIELGPDAQPAIPALIKMLGARAKTTNDFSPVAGTAYVVLTKMAPVSIAPLINALSSKDLQVYALAAGALGEIGPPASAAIPVMQQKLTDTNVMVRIGAAEILEKLGTPPGVFMPVVIESLRDPDYSSLDEKLNILTRHTDEARTAVPILLNILTNAAKLDSVENRFVRQQVGSALRQIRLGNVLEPHEVK